MPVSTSRTHLPSGATHNLLQNHPNPPYSKQNWLPGLQGASTCDVGETVSLKFSNKKQEKFQLNCRCNHQRGLGVVAQNQSSSSSTRLPVVFEDEVAEEEERDDSEVDVTHDQLALPSSPTMSELDLVKEELEFVNGEFLRVNGELEEVTENFCSCYQKYEQAVEEVGDLKAKLEEKTNRIAALERELQEVRRIKVDSPSRNNEAADMNIQVEVDELQEQAGEITGDVVIPPPPAFLSGVEKFVTCK
ncbi:unnamed protein product [Amoebophrya sp. A120]|nr:unnamed protein product [Amoebophrya sp. A120]|eukprot:GSA120T00013115001.1